MGTLSNTMGTCRELIETLQELLTTWRTFALLRFLLEPTNASHENETNLKFLSRLTRIFWLLKYLLIFY